MEGLKTLNNPYWLYGLIIGGIGWGFGAVLLLLGQKFSDAVTPTICASALLDMYGNPFAAVIGIISVTAEATNLAVLNNLLVIV